MNEHSSKCAAQYTRHWVNTSAICHHRCESVLLGHYYTRFINWVLTFLSQEPCRSVAVNSCIPASLAILAFNLEILALRPHHQTLAAPEETGARAVLWVYELAALNH